MNYYHRFLDDGGCEIICTRCFLSIGIAHGHLAVKTLEGKHACPKDHKPALPASRASSPVLLLLLLAVLFLYALPTALEFIAMPYVGPWISTILFGDLCGCVCLAVVFKLRRESVLLYAALLTCEGVLFGLHALPASALTWIVDLVPTLVVMSRIAPLYGSSRISVPR